MSRCVSATGAFGVERVTGVRPANAAIVSSTIRASFKLSVWIATCHIERIRDAQDTRRFAAEGVEPQSSCS